MGQTLERWFVPGLLKIAWTGRLESGHLLALSTSGVILEPPRRLKLDPSGQNAPNSV